MLEIKPRVLIHSVSWSAFGVMFDEIRIDSGHSLNPQCIVECFRSLLLSIGYVDSI